MKKVCIAFCLIMGTLNGGELHEEDVSEVTIGPDGEYKKGFFVDAWSGLRGWMYEEGASDAQQEKSDLVKNRIMAAISMQDTLALEDLLNRVLLTTSEKTALLELARQITCMFEKEMVKRVTITDALRLGFGGVLLGVAGFFGYTGYSHASLENDLENHIGTFMFCAASSSIAAVGLFQIYRGLTKEQRTSRLSKAYAVEAMLRRA